MINKEKLTIVVILYNHSRYLKKITHDLSKQTINNFNIIFSDDNSKDDTLKKLENILESDFWKNKILSEQLSVHNSNSNRGIIDHFNYILSIVKTEYIFMISGDDRIHPKFCEIMYPNLKKPYTCITPNQFRINNQDKIIGKSSFKQKNCFSLEKIIKEDNFGIPSAGSIYALEPLKKYGALNCKLSNEDDQFLFRSILNGKRLIIDDYIFYYRVHFNSASSWHRNAFLPKKIIFYKHQQEHLNREFHLKEFKSILEIKGNINLNKKNKILDLIDERIWFHQKKGLEIDKLLPKKGFYKIFKEYSLRLRALKLSLRFYFGCLIRRLFN